MALRIGTNVDALNAIRNLDLVTQRQNANVGRLSSGLRIRTAADDPSGLVMSENLRGQIASLRAADSTVTRANNVIGTAEAALSTAGDLLSKIKEAISRAQGDASALGAEQGNIDTLLSAIDSLGSNTAFGGTKLLDGSSASQITAKSNVNAVAITGVNLGGQASRNFAVKLTQRGEGASFTLAAHTAWTTASGVTFTVTTNKGSVAVTVGSSSTTATAVATALAQGAAAVGVYSSGAGLFTRDQGSDTFLSITVSNADGFGGTGTIQLTSTRMLASITLNTSSEGVSGTASGQDFAGTIGGKTAGGDGYSLIVYGSDFSGVVELDPTNISSTVTSYSGSFTVKQGGQNFVIGTSAADKVNVSLPRLGTEALGSVSFTIGGETVGGFVNSLRSGGSNALSAGEFDNAIFVVDKAISQILTTRTALGGLQKNTLEPRQSQIGVEMTNLAAVESSIREVDFASEISDFTKNQILFQAGTSVLAAANASQAAVLTLLGGF